MSSFKSCTTQNVSNCISTLYFNFREKSSSFWADPDPQLMDVQQIYGECNELTDANPLNLLDLIVWSLTHTHKNEKLFYKLPALTWCSDGHTYLSEETNTAKEYGPVASRSSPSVSSINWRERETINCCRQVAKVQKSFDTSDKLLRSKTL